MFKRVWKNSAEEARQNVIRSIVEFFPLDPVSSQGGGNWELFDTSPNASRFLKELRQALEQSHGIYVFYDTRGRALYAGKAKKQFLWNEMNDAYNRDRGGRQYIYGVEHPTPTRNNRFRPGYEQTRKVTRNRVVLVDLAGYFSAYDIQSTLIDATEALIVRAFANDLLNSRIETL